jgi:hypothetical protein
VRDDLEMSLFAVSTGVAIAYAVALFLLLIVLPLTVTGLKGHWLLFAAGWLTVGVVWWIAALRLARPNSWWARRFYDDDKLRRAQRRYGDETALDS